MTLARFDAPSPGNNLLSKTLHLTPQRFEI
jgi:hypothetical protein